MNDVDSVLDTRAVLDVVRAVTNGSNHTKRTKPGWLEPSGTLLDGGRRGEVQLPDLVVGHETDPLELRVELVRLGRSIIERVPAHELVQEAGSFSRDVSKRTGSRNGIQAVLDSSHASGPVVVGRDATRPEHQVERRATEHPVRQDVELQWNQRYKTVPIMYPLCNGEPQTALGILDRSLGRVRLRLMRRDQQGLGPVPKQCQSEPCVVEFASMVGHDEMRRAVDSHDVGLGRPQEVPSTH